MASALLRTTPAVRAGLRAGLRAASKPAAAMASTSFVRGKATLPDLPCKRPSTAQPAFPIGISVNPQFNQRNAPVRSVANTPPR